MNKIQKNLVFDQCLYIWSKLGSILLSIFLTKTTWRLSISVRMARYTVKFLK